VTERLAEYLTAKDGVINLAIERSRARLPDGDMVQFDVMRSAANGALAQLRALGLYRSSSVIVQEVDAALVDTADRADWRVTYHGEYAPVWDVVAANINETAAQQRCAASGSSGADGCAPG
jgi:hypothetical protein